MTPIKITSHAQLDALVAEKVAGWVPTKQQIDAWQTWAHVSGCDTSRENAEQTAKICDRPHFSRSADAVLPLLNQKAWTCEATNGAIHTMVTIYGAVTNHSAIAHAFPLAACLALLRAHGIQAELAADFQ
jgi:hypothetical protein